ncbi:LOB domain-containing protein 29 [Linum grandiflorum]
MTGSGSPCGACKFLRRKCVRGCVFAPYFCHEQGATHFAAIHKVFGASNVSKLLAHLPVSDRCEAAVTISYEAQARLQDPIYGCVSHIFALQQQVVNLQAQLASLKEQAGQSFVNNSAYPSANPSNARYTSSSTPMQDLQSWLHQQYPQQNMEYNNQNNNNNNNMGGVYMENYGSSSNNSFDSFEDASNSMDINQTDRKWAASSADDLQSVAFGYYHH